MIYNTKVSLISLVEADSEDEAIAKMVNRLYATLPADSPFDLYEEGRNAFPSEPGTKADF